MESTCKHAHQRSCTCTPKTVSYFVSSGRPFLSEWLASRHTGGELAPRTLTHHLCVLELPPLSATSLPHPTQNPELLAVKQVADLLGISPRLVWILAKQGILPAVRIRRCTRWRRADILAFVDHLTAQRGHSPDKGVAHVD